MEVKSVSFDDEQHIVGSNVGLSEPDGLAAFLVRTGRLKREALSRALAIQSSQNKESVPEILTNLGLISADDLADGIAEYAGVERIKQSLFPEHIVDLEGLNVSFLRSYKVLPISMGEDRSLVVAAVDPTDEYVRDALAFVHNGSVNFLVATAREIEENIDRLYSEDRSGTDGETVNLSDDVERLRELASDAPVVKFVDRLIEEALLGHASDIHFELTEKGLRCRLRIDGVLKDTSSAPPDLATAVISRIKIMSGLDIAERRLPQDGRMRHRAAGKEIDFRIATAPTASGEGAVVRLLDKTHVDLQFDDLGFEGETGRPLLNAIGKPDGIVLVTGPTGSGKTTTLYTALAYLNHPDKKILTIEDPVEYLLPGINQTQIEPKIGRSFAVMLRSFLRQDPDIIMVGEIRDRETAEIAIQAALTGHLVLSTLHTNDAASAITRLLDMGIESFLISSTVRLIIAQRLIRRLCNMCKQVDDPAEVLMQPLQTENKFSEGTFYRPGSCAACLNSGYMGRTTISESLVINDDIKHLIHGRAEAGKIHKSALDRGMKSMLDHGLERVQKGETTMEEVLRVTMRR